MDNEVNKNKIYNLEKKQLCDNNKSDLIESVITRRNFYNIPNNLPFENFDYSKIYKKNCENVIGYIQIPVGLVGPININDVEYNVPIATTEGALVASINRGCKIINMAGGVNSVVKHLGITRTPIIKVEKLEQIKIITDWVDKNYKTMSEKFNETTKYGKLTSVNIFCSSLEIHLRFTAFTGDAMGMNMISKGVKNILNLIKDLFSFVTVISLSGNMCTDKKVSNINWILGRGRHIINEVFLSEEFVNKILKTTCKKIHELNISKNLIGSSMAGCVGGNNSHIANIIAGIYAATGQDLAQIGTSSIGILTTNLHDNGIHVMISMPSIELATIGGGTNIESQKSCLKIMNIDMDKCNKNLNYEPGSSADKLAHIVGAIALAGELSLLASLCENTLIETHLKLNR